MSVAKHAKDLAEPEFGRAKKIYVWEHGDIYSKCHEIFINPNHLRTFNSILNYLTSSLNPVFGAIRKLVSIKTKKCINCFTDLEHNGRYIAVGVNKCIKFSAKRYRTCSEYETKMTKKNVKRFYSGDVGEAELRFLCETQKRKLTIFYVLMNGITCQSPFKVVLTGREILSWDTILGYLDSILDAPTGIQNLCTIYGDIILDPSELQHGYVYIALPFNEKFVDMDYMAFFTDWEDDRSKKKGLLSNIRRSSRKYGKDYFCKDVPVGDKKSYTVPCECDPKCVEKNESCCTCLHTEAQNRGENDPTDYGLQSEYDDTQTVCMDKNQAVIPGSEICIYINIDEGGKSTQICPGVCPAVQRTQNVVQCMPQTAEPVDKGKRTIDKTQTDAFSLNPYNKPRQKSNNKEVDKKVNKSNLNEGESKQNGDNTEYITVSVIVSKSSKAVGKSQMQQNSTNIILTKTCEARTLCPNIPVSGSFSKKVGVITDIVNNVVNETYGRLTQTENRCLKKDEKIPIMNGGDADNTTRGRMVNTGKSQNVEDNKSSFKLNDNKVGERPNTPFGVKCIRIQNKTFINVCDPAEEGKDQSENKVTFCDKCTSSPHIPGCPYATKEPQIDEYKCCVCATSTMNPAISDRKSNEANKTENVPSSAKSSQKTRRDKSAHSPKAASVRKNTVPIPKEESKISKHASQASKNSKNTLETQTQNITRVSLEMKTDNGKEHDKSVQNSMSVDSLSEEVTRKDESNNQAPPTQKENGKDAVAITVNISKANGPKTTEENGGAKVNDVYSSKIVVDGNFTDKYDDVKSILSDIVGATFQKLMLADSEVENVDRKQLMTSESEEINYGAPMPPKVSNVTTDPAEKTNVSSPRSKLSKDSKSQTSKTSFDKISENKNNIHITVVPPRVCTPVVHMQGLGLCENYKSKGQTPDNKAGMLTDVYCLCDTSRKQDSVSCTCSEYSSSAHTNRQETKALPTNCCICTKYPANIQDKSETKKGNEISNDRESRRPNRSNQGPTNRKTKDTKENTNRSFQNGKGFRENKKSDGSEAVKRISEKNDKQSILSNKKSKTSESVHSQTRKNEKLIGVISFTKSTETEDIVEPSKKSVKQRSASSNRGRSESRNNERRSQIPVSRKNRENDNVSAQRQNRNPGAVQNGRSKSKKREKSGDFAAERRESEISVDSIDDNQCCCICVCSPNYTMKLNGTGN